MLAGFFFQQPCLLRFLSVLQQSYGMLLISSTSSEGIPFSSNSLLRPKDTLIGKAAPPSRTKGEEEEVGKLKNRKVCGRGVYGRRNAVAH